MPDQSRILIDTDIFIILAAAGVLERVVELLGYQTSDLRRLPATLAQLKRGKWIKSRYPSAAREKAIETCALVPVLNERPESDDILDRLAGVNEIDLGETLLYGIASLQSDYLIASGDKRAMIALASDDTLHDIRNSIAGRVICTEVVLRILIESDGIETVASSFQQIRDSNNLLRVIFSEAQATDQETSLQALDSYIKDLEQQVGKDFLYKPE